jgi:putative transposase
VREGTYLSDAKDYRFYLDWLGEHADKTGCQVLLMTNHVHLLLSAAQSDALADTPEALVKVLGRRYATGQGRLIRVSNRIQSPP